MSAHERLRQLHAEGIVQTTDAGQNYGDFVLITEAQRDSLANLAEAAADSLLHTPRHHLAFANGCRDCRIAKALADLEQALNPTGNTQSQA